MTVFKPDYATRNGGGMYARLTFENNDDRRRFDQQANFRGEPMIEDLLLAYKVVRSTEHPGEASAPSAIDKGLATTSIRWSLAGER